MPIIHLKLGVKCMKKWLLIQLNWKNEMKKGNLHNIKGLVRRIFDDYAKLEAYIEVLKDMRKMGEVPKDAGFLVVDLDE